MVFRQVPKPVTASGVDLDTVVVLEQDRILHQNLPLAVVMAMMVAGLLAAVFQDHPLALPWVISMVLVLAGRMLADRHYWQADTDPVAVHRWRRAYALGVLLTGLGWAAAAPLFVLDADLMHQTIGVLILVGVAAGAVPVMSARISLYITYALLVVLPVSAVLFFRAHYLFTLLGIACLLLTATLVRSAHAMSTQLMQAVRQRFERDQALQSLEQTHARMEEAVVMAQFANRAKSEFLANMSHEIRTPLNAVLGFAQIGLRDSRGRRSNGHFGQILTAGQHLLGVINDILDLSKMEAGKLEVESQPFRLAAAIDEAIQLVTDRAGNKGLKLEVSQVGALPAWVVGDMLRIKQILVNLLGNAVKFTEQGRIVLSLQAEGEWVRLAVIDTGSGLSPEQIERLFTPFEQLDATTTRRHGGSGLGLTICRRLARLMGGDVTVDSQVGVGSTFTLRLPLPEAAPGEEHAPHVCQDTHRLQGLRLLVAEDVDVNRAIIEEMLVHEGAAVAFAENGLQAVERLQTEGLDAYDLVLMDIQMPVMDGYAATRRIRELTHDLPVIGLTAHAMSEEKSRCLSVGMVQHVAKPIDLETLVAAIRRHAKTGAPRVVPVVETPPLPAPESAPSVAVADEAVSELPVIDWAELRAQFKPAFIDKLVRMILENHQTTPQRIRQCLAQRDMTELTFLSHSLKGLAGNIMAPRVFDLGKRTHAALHANSDEAIRLAEQLAQDMEALLAEAARFQASQVLSDARAA